MMSKLNNVDRKRIIKNINSNINALYKLRKEAIRNNYDVLNSDSLAVNLNLSYLEYYKDKILKDENMGVAKLVDDLHRFLDSLTLSEQTKQIILLHAWLIEMFARFEGLDINDK